MNKKVLELLKAREFVSVATCDLQGRPNAAPKFILKLENNSIYLVDYIIGRTFQNIKVNPRVSISFIDSNALMGYQLNGSVKIIGNGQEYDSLVKDLSRKELELSTRRIIEGVTKGKSHEGFELGMSEKFVILKVKIEEVVEIASSGSLKREKICE
ncbi:MAG: pyridoxamine 5'-phosphate oxidase family protein [Candidatus Omnitrophota bacterium]|jgi:predicted pyridoxine 5'-phosphate oxidase superfamily flavin-nucleotide-binding protein